MAYTSRIPASFVDRVDMRNCPSIAYCQQNLVAASRGSGPPPERTGDVISAFRKIVKHRDVFPLSEVLNVLRSQDEFSDLCQYFKSTQDVILFAESLPQYFEVTVGNRALGFSCRFLEVDFKNFLKRQGRRIQRRGVPPPFVVVNDVHECQRQVHMLLDRAMGRSQLVLAVDCEGVKLGKEGPLTLLQIGTVEGEVFVFDILATPNREDMFIRGGLKKLLEDPTIVKVIHDCRADQCALYFQFGVVLRNVFDTSAAYTTIWEQCNILSGPFRPKLADFLDIYGLKAEHKTRAFARKVQDGGIFGQRPLTREMIEYAMDDVLCLVPTIYENMDRLISQLWRPHFEKKVELDLAESRVTDPRLMYEAKRGR